MSAQTIIQRRNRVDAEGEVVQHSRLRRDGVTFIRSSLVLCFFSRSAPSRGRWPRADDQLGACRGGA